LGIGETLAEPLSNCRVTPENPGFFEVDIGDVLKLIRGRLWIFCLCCLGTWV
jgi:hypothetical protein